MQTPSTQSTGPAARSRGAVSLRLVAPVGTAVAGALVVAAIGTNLAGQSGASCSGDARTVAVAAAPEIAPVVAEAARRLDTDSGAGCEQVVVTARSAALVTAGLRSPKAARPDIWVPDSSVWLARAGVAIRPAGPDPSVATSPAVLAVSRDTAVALGWPARPLDLEGLAATGDQPPPVRFTGLDPRASAAGTGVLLGLQSTLAGRSDATVAFTATVQSAQVGEGSASAATLTAVSTSAQPLAAATSEQAVFVHDVTSPADRQVVAAYPRRAAVALDYPMVLPTQDRRAADVATRLLAVLRSRAGQQLVQSQGFRSVEGAPGRELTLQKGLDWKVPLRASQPGSQAVEQVVNGFAAMTRPTRMLAVFDVSGSMGEIVPGAGGASRMDLTRAAAAEALGLFPETANVGLWEFSTNLTPTTDYREILPIVPAAGAARESLAVALAGLREVPTGDTALYDTVLAAVREVRAGYDPQRTNTVVVLTDGRNEDPDGIDLDTLLRRLQRENDPERPVQVVAVVFGDGDADALGAITDATGGSTYVARDPRQVRVVFLDAVSRHS